MITETMTEQEREDCFRAIGRVRDSQIADLLTLVVGIAAERNPEQLRAALARVFDLSAIQCSHDRMMLVLAKAEEHLNKVSDRVRGMERVIDQFEGRLQCLALRPNYIARGNNSTEADATTSNWDT